MGNSLKNNCSPSFILNYCKNNSSVKTPKLHQTSNIIVPNNTPIDTPETSNITVPNNTPNSPINNQTNIIEKKFKDHVLRKIDVFKITNANELKIQQQTHILSIEEIKACKSKTLHEYVLDELHWGYVIDVYDGDTITIITKFDFLNTNNFIKLKIRLNDIDAPEIRTKNEAEKEKALEVKKYLQDLILWNYVILSDVKFESKWSRYLATVSIVKDGENFDINKHLIEKKIVKKYNGGHKETWKDDELILTL